MSFHMLLTEVPNAQYRFLQSFSWLKLFCCSQINPLSLSQFSLLTYLLSMKVWLLLNQDSFSYTHQALPWMGVSTHRDCYSGRKSCQNPGPGPERSWWLRSGPPAPALERSHRHKCCFPLLPPLHPHHTPWSRHSCSHQSVKQEMFCFNIR